MSFSAKVVLKNTGDSHTGEVQDMVNVEDNEAAVRAIDAASEVVYDLFDRTMVFGRNWPDHDWVVNINGHFNEDHKPVEGSANDFLQITITQA